MIRIASVRFRNHLVRSPVSIHLLIVLLVVAGSYVLHPLLVLEVPLDCLADAFVKHCLRLPADLSLDLVRCDGVSTVMTLSVCYVLDKVIRKMSFSWIRVVKLLSEYINDGLNDLDVLLLVVSANVALAWSSTYNQSRTFLPSP